MKLLKYKKNQKDNSLFIEIPAGEFLMGDSEDCDNLQHSVYLDSYLISLFVVTNQQFNIFVEETAYSMIGHSDSYGLKKWTYFAKYANHPALMSYCDAVNYCNWAGLVLPTEAQWEKAAAGPQNYIYPWGNEWIPKNCLSYYNKGIEETCPVDAFPQGVSGYFLYNCAGNVLEWCHDWYDENYYSLSPYRNPVGPESGEYKVARGGSWGHGKSECRCCSRANYNYPNVIFDFIGFRTVLPVAGY